MACTRRSPAGLLRSIRWRSPSRSADDQSTTVVQKSSVTEAQRYLGQKSKWVVGALIGATAGGVIGWALTGDDEESDPINEYVESGRDVWAIGLSMIAGGFFGGGIGNTVTSDRWETVPLKSLDISMGGSSSARHPVVALTISF